jgi:hypothetical protein
MLKTHEISFPSFFPSDPAKYQPCTGHTRTSGVGRAATHRDTMQVIENYPNCLKIQMWPITHSGFLTGIIRSGGEHGLTSK